MSLADIISAGIDIHDPENYHVYRYEVKLTFGVEQYFLFNFVEQDGDGNRQVVKRKIYLNNTEATIIGQKISVDEEMYMIISGECKWLKEFYEVQLLVINNDNLPLTDCSAVLNVPDGLTLVNSPAVQECGDLMPNESLNTKWYVRGDKAGDYDLTATFSGMNDGHPDEYVFKTENPLHVYAGNALEMTIYAPEFSYYSEDYEISLHLKNVSHKPIYNLQHTIKSIEQSYKADIYVDKLIGQDLVLHKEGVLQHSDPNKTLSLPVLNPGETMVVTIRLKDIWQSVAEKVTMRNKLLFDYVGMISSMLPGYWGFAPGLIASTMSAFYASINTEHVLRDISVVTLEGSTTEIPWKKVYTEVPPEIKAKYETGDMLTNVMWAGVSSVLSEKFGSAVNAADFLGGIVNAKNDDDVSEAWKSWGREALCEVADEGLGIIFDNNGLDVEGPSIPINDIITVVEDLMYFYNPAQAGTEGKEVEFAVITNYGQVIPKEPNGAPGGRRAKSAAPSTYDLFDITIEDGDYTERDGKIYLNGPAVIRITPKQANVLAKVSLKSEDGTVDFEKYIATVPEHECTGEHFFMAPAHDGETAVEATFCEICGEFMASDHLPEDAVAMLSTGENFNDISEAADAANASDEDVKLYIFGNVDLTENVSFNENVEVLIAPDTIINSAENCTFEANGEFKDYRSNEENNTVKIRLNYWDGRSEEMTVENGTRINSLPQLDKNACCSGVWYKDSEHTKAFEPFTAGENCSYYAFYADTHHSFNNRGICTVCGELKNGKDAFLKASASVDDNITIKLTAALSTDAAKDKNAFAEFNFEDGKVSVQKLSKALNNGDGTYTFSCIIDPTYIDTSFKVQLHYSDGTVGSELTYSARKYLNALRSMNILDEDSSAFIDSLINFAERLKEYTGETVSEENDITLNGDTSVSDDYKIAARSSGSKLKASFASMSMSGHIALTIRFNLEEGKSISDYKFTVDGKKVLAVQEGNVASITLSKITPNMYGIMHTFRAESSADPSVYAEVDYSAFTYAKLAFEKCDDEKLINAMQALVIYGKAAKKLR